ncbi:MAG: hypothetical protein Q9228_002456, partial [Teloschistes exilis]
ELDGTPMAGTVAGNRLKHFHTRAISTPNLQGNVSRTEQNSNDSVPPGGHIEPIDTDMHIEVMVPDVDDTAPLDFVED